MEAMHIHLFLFPATTWPVVGPLSLLASPKERGKRSKRGGSLDMLPACYDLR